MSTETPSKCCMRPDATGRYVQSDYCHQLQELLDTAYHELSEARAQLAERRKTALHAAWQECKIIESRLTASGDPYDDHLSQVATECVDAIQKLAG